MKTSTKWKHRQVFESSQESNSITVDGDRIEGMSPKALLLAGLAGCSGIDVVEALEKMRVEFSNFSIDTETEQTDTHPKVFKDIFITYFIKTNLANKERVEKAINLSLEKYCGVAAMLKKNSAIHHKLQLVE